ncbi:hypothetical protein FNI11_07300 [Salmonella enterica subsp. salamae]|nr:hypothetical protein [Salmonella enterica subsp. salamae]ECJ2282753.1 hypothetical protein [Salmonella enterica subsp. salamae]
MAADVNPPCQSNIAPVTLGAKSVKWTRNVSLAKCCCGLPLVSAPAFCRQINQFAQVKAFFREPKSQTAPTI